MQSEPTHSVTSTAARGGGKPRKPAPAGRSFSDVMDRIVARTGVSAEKLASRWGVAPTTLRAAHAYGRGGLKHDVEVGVCDRMAIEDLIELLSAKGGSRVVIKPRDPGPLPGSREAVRDELIRVMAAQTELMTLANRATTGADWMDVASMARGLGQRMDRIVAAAQILASPRSGG